MEISGNTLIIMKWCFPILPTELREHEDIGEVGERGLIGDRPCECDLVVIEMTTEARSSSAMRVPAYRVEYSAAQ